MRKKTTGHVLFPILAAALAVGTSFLGGCGYMRQARDNVAMAAVPAAERAQTLNPEAGRNRRVVAGLDGEAAKRVSESYAKSFSPEEQKPPSVTFMGFKGVGNE